MKLVKLFRNKKAKRKMCQYKKQIERPPDARRSAEKTRQAAETEKSVEEENNTTCSIVHVTTNGLTHRDSMPCSVATLVASFRPSAMTESAYQCKLLFTYGFS